MKTVIIEYSGWIKCDIEDVEFIDIETGSVKTGTEWLNTIAFIDGVKSLDGLHLADFGEAYRKAVDGDLYQLDMDFTQED